MQVSKNGQKQSKVNINKANKANKEKLMTLPGVGESTALKIIEYRTQNGDYKSIEDLKKVAGIGDSKFNNLKEYVTVK